MKRIFTLMALVAISMSSMAQKASEMTRCLARLPEKNIVGNVSEQGRDKLDSLYYLNAKIYEFPYNTAKEKKVVDNLTASLVKAYDQDLPRHTGGYCATSVLRPGNPIKSSQLAMYYGEGHEALVVGGTGHNYAVLRMNCEQNPNYRHIKGVEWWLEQDEQKQLTVQVKAFTLSGPQSESHYLYAWQQSDKANQASEAKRHIDALTEISLSSKDELLKGIRVLAKLYKGTNSEVDRAVIKSINDRVVAYVTGDNTREDYLRLLRAMAEVDNYVAYIIYPEGYNKGYGFDVIEKYLERYEIVKVGWTALDDDPNSSVTVDKPKPVHYGLNIYTKRKR